MTCDIAKRPTLAESHKTKCQIYVTNHGCIRKVVGLTGCGYQSTQDLRCRLCLTLLGLFQQLLAFLDNLLRCVDRVLFAFWVKGKNHCAESLQRIALDLRIRGIENLGRTQARVLAKPPLNEKRTTKDRLTSVLRLSQRSDAYP
jgi:hypothetical protein